MTTLNHPKRNRKDPIWNTGPRPEAIDWGTPQGASSSDFPFHVDLGRTTQRRLALRLADLDVGQVCFVAVGHRDQHHCFKLQRPDPTTWWVTPDQDLPRVAHLYATPAMGAPEPALAWVVHPQIVVRRLAACSSALPHQLDWWFATIDGLTVRSNHTAKVMEVAA